MDNKDYGQEQFKNIGSYQSIISRNGWIEIKQRLPDIFVI